MIQYRKILELHDEDISLRGIAASTGHSRQKIDYCTEIEPAVQTFVPPCA